MVGSENNAETKIPSRDYSKEDLWNLNSESLQPLILFLKEKLKY
jgi:hypothetical protein